MQLISPKNGPFRVERSLIGCCRLQPLAARHRQGRTTSKPPANRQEATGNHNYSNTTNTSNTHGVRLPFLERMWHARRPADLSEQ